jgi:hypothetical protein
MREKCKRVCALTHTHTHIIHTHLDTPDLVWSGRLVIFVSATQTVLFVCVYVCEYVCLCVCVCALCWGHVQGRGSFTRNFHCKTYYYTHTHTHTVSSITQLERVFRLCNVHPDWVSVQSSPVPADHHYTETYVSSLRRASAMFRVTHGRASTGNALRSRRNVFN